jgi:hypothetical protein
LSIADWIGDVGVRAAHTIRNQQSRQSAISNQQSAIQRT